MPYTTPGIASGWIIKAFSAYTREIETFIKETYSQFSEREKRRYAAVEALKLPRGGNSYIANLLNCSRTTIIRGIKELKTPEAVPQNKIRKKGGGRKSAIEIIENIDEVFLKVIDDHIAGDPMNEKIRWTNLSHKKIAQLKEQYLMDSNPVVSVDTQKKSF